MGSIFSFSNILNQSWVTFIRSNVHFHLATDSSIFNDRCKYQQRQIKNLLKENESLACVSVSIQITTEDSFRQNGWSKLAAQLVTLVRAHTCNFLKCFQVREWQHTPGGGRFDRSKKKKNWIYKKKLNQDDEHWTGCQLCFFFFLVVAFGWCVCASVIGCATKLNFVFG